MDELGKNHLQQNLMENDGNPCSREPNNSQPWELLSCSLSHTSGSTVRQDRVLLKSDTVLEMSFTVLPATDRKKVTWMKYFEYWQTMFCHLELVLRLCKNWEICRFQQRYLPISSSFDTVDPQIEFAIRHCGNSEARPRCWFRVSGLVA